MQSIGDSRGWRQARPDAGKVREDFRLRSLATGPLGTVGRAVGRPEPDSVYMRRRLVAAFAAAAFLVVVIAVENLGSNRVAERAGFTREGVLRQYRENKGIWRDHYMWSLLRGEL